MSGIVWQTPPSALIAAVEAHGARVQLAVQAVGQLMAPKIEAYAKANGPWVDRTGQARAGLTGLSEASADLVTIYLYHQAEHGIFLEVCNGGKYQILQPALSAHYGEIMALIKSIVGGV